MVNTRYFYYKPSLRKIKEGWQNQGHAHAAGGIPITDTVPSIWLVRYIRYILLLAGLYAMSHGAIPTVIVSAMTLLVSTTETVLEHGSPPKLVTYICRVEGLYAILCG